MALKLPNEITKELAEEVGWHIGDGSMNFYSNHGIKKGIYQLRGHIEDDRLHYLNRIKPLFKLLYGLDISLREMPSTRVFGFQIWNNELVKFKEGLGLPLGKKLDVQIPNALLNNDQLKAAVVRGIFDTDGTVYLQKRYGKLYPRLEISTISLKLAEQLCTALNQLGLRATFNTLNKVRGNRLVSYKVNVRGVEMLHNFMKIISPKNPKHLLKYSRFRQSLNN